MTHDGEGRTSFEPPDLSRYLAGRHSKEFEVSLLSHDFCPGLELLLEWKRFVRRDGNL